MTDDTVRVTSTSTACDTRGWVKACKQQASTCRQLCSVAARPCNPNVNRISFSLSHTHTHSLNVKNKK